jgi:transglutaminase-like putative cysteine protease
MLIRAGFAAAFDFVAPTPIVLMPHVHPSRAATIQRLEALSATVPPGAPPVEFIHYHDAYGNFCARTVAPAGRVAFRTDAILHDDGLPDRIVPTALQHRVQDLPNHVMVFLLASRYCEVDSELRNTAWSLFGNLPAGWSLVQAVCDYVHNHIRFDYMQARANRTALEAYRERTGVCRDYMHLAVTFCRSLNIPARYCTGYLGDIGVPRLPDPMDFSAWFEVYLGGEWHAFDARNNKPRIGRILMARGRDAADVAIMTSFGVNTLASFEVWTDEVAALPAGVGTT